MIGGFGWLSVARLGLVQACLGAVVVMTTSTLNRVMVVELALPALLPGLLVAMHYLVQVDVVITTIAPRQACTSPSRATAAQPKPPLTAPPPHCAARTR